MGLESFKRYQNGYVTSPFGICYSYVWTLMFVGKKKKINAYGALCFIVFFPFVVAYYVFAVEERNKLSYVQNNKVANTIEMYQLYGGVVVMTFNVFVNSLKRKRLIEAVSLLNDVDRRISKRDAVDYCRTRNRSARTSNWHVRAP